MLKKVIKGGPANHQYKLHQFHMHWSDTFIKGSEHLVDNKPYAAEV